MMDADWIEWYYRMCDDIKPMFPNVSASAEHFNLENISEQYLRQCCCKRTCISSPCFAYRQWKRSFLRQEENRDQLDAFCRDDEEDMDAILCRDILLWIWFRLAQRQEQSLYKTFDETLIEN
jgi:hypothetical protein